ncbi:aldose 1-epimerase [mine drainage metagenome]|uniref:Aldose 1-epimerase n=1 Tax=mine drainage metagenome TaxID=410659 RepID=A0A1J5T8Z0_9ZZZZ
MKNFTISNSFLNVVIASRGAELQNIFNKQTSLEYLWNGDEKFWAKRSPVLFPIVGGLKDNTYFYNNQSYQIKTRHGFARDSEFEVVEQNADSIRFSMQPNEETNKNYPFSFEFQIFYQLIENKVSVTYFIKNTDDKNILFSVGAHPAFNVPLVDGTQFSDYYLLFNETENAGKYPLSKDGLIEKEAVPFLINTNKLPLTKELFYNDALVFKHLASNSISIVSDKTKHGLKVVFDDFPYMGIWNFKDADFVCIEPWCGIADTVDTTQQLAEKEGINNLHAGENFKRTWTVEVF